ncbi:MAG: sulfatase [Myxococcota bacterium]
MLLLLGCGPLPRGDAERPDIVLVSIDSLRADHLGSYGYPRDTTPNLDALAKDGLRFTQARAASPWTLPSHMTMFTGLWPTEHQVIEDDLTLAPSVPVVTEALKEAGYATAAFVSTLYVGGDYGFARGFDTYADYDITERQNLAHAVRVDRLVTDAIAWVKATGERRPVFLFVHIYDVHYPYFPPEPWNEKYDRAGRPEELRYRNYRYYQQRPLSEKRMAHQVAQYDESLAWVDHELGRLIDAFDDSRRPAWWIVTSDHGEELGERGSWGHAHTLYPEVLDIPLIVAGPGVDAAVRGERTGTIDIAATLAAMAGVPWGKGPGVDLRGPVPERTFYAETSRFDSARLSVQKGGKRLDVDLAADERRLYDRTADPGEVRSIEAGAAKGEAAALEAELFGALGAGWAADAGVVRSTGWVWSGTGTPTKSLAGPATFGVYPPDAEVVLEGDAPVAKARGIVDAPTDGPLRYTGPRNVVGISLDAETRAKLEALGYVQE